MHRQKYCSLALAVAATILPGIAAAAEPPCLTQGEFTALTIYALPSVITATAKRCEAILPADAFLRTDSAALAARYADASVAEWPDARAAFLKLAQGAGAGNVAKGLSDDTLQQIANSAIAGKIADALPVARCGSVNALVKLLAPLPPANVAEVVALAVGLGTKSGRQIGPIAVCPA